MNLDWTYFVKLKTFQFTEVANATGKSFESVLTQKQSLEIVKLANLGREFLNEIPAKIEDS